MHMNHTENNANFNAGAAVLWASAFVILAMIIVQAGRLQGNAAHAEMVADRGSYTLMTADSGRGGDEDPDEILYVIDSREQTLLVYEVEDARKRQISFRQGEPLDLLFQRARQ
jgi:hypothetical protein